MMSQPKASEQKTTMLYRSWLSELKETKGALNRAPTRRAASTETPLTVSGHDGRYSPEVSPRLSWDPTHYVRVREVREDEQGGIIPTQIRILAREFPSRCCFWPDPHRRVLRRINGHFLVVVLPPPPPWRMLWLPLTKMWAGWSFPPKCSDLFEQTSKRRDSAPDWADMAGELVVGILYNLFLPLLLLAGESPCSFSS